MKVKELGFTLVEMMAVIILLGVVSLVAIPQVNKIIRNTRMSVFKDSAYGVIRAGELYYRNKEINREPLIDTTFVFPNATGLEINGDVPKSGKMVITSDGSIKLAISNGKYCARKDYDDSKVSVNEDINNCTLESVETENPGGGETGGSGSGDGTGENTGTTQLITNLELNTTSVSVINGGIYQIEATITPTSATNKTLRYTSNNESVATVSSTGLITGIAGGETTVTVSTTDGSNISESIDVIVRQQISNVELDITSASIDVGESILVNAAITPSNAYIKTLKWESSNERVATVNNGIITGVNPGTTVITATTQDGTLIENKVTITVKEYSITYNTDGGTIPSDAITSYHANTSTFNLPTATKTGYTLEGWYENEDLSGNKVTQIIKGTKENKVYYAKWVPSTNTPYTVKHYQMNLDGSTYTLKDTENLTGTTLTNVTPAVKSYTGFTSPSTESATIKADGSTVVEYKYTRNQYYLDLKGNLNGTDSDNIANYGTVDIYVNDVKVATGVTDYNQKHYYGSSYEITNIKADSTRQYDGVYSGSLTGTITGATSVSLKFTTSKLYIINAATSTYVGSWKFDGNNFGQTVTQTSSGLKFYKYAYQAGVTFSGQTGIDVTNYNTMVVTISAVGGTSESNAIYTTHNRFGLSTSKTANSDAYNDYSKYTVYTFTNRKTGTYTIDISSLTGTYYPRIFLISQSADAYITISELYFK